MTTTISEAATAPLPPTTVSAAPGRAASAEPGRAASAEPRRAASVELSASSSAQQRWRKGYRVEGPRTPYTRSPRGATRTIVELDRPIYDARMRPPLIISVKSVLKPAKQEKSSEKSSSPDGKNA